MQPDRQPESEAEYEATTDEAIKQMVCEYAGHDLVDAGGGLMICINCRAEEWDERGDLLESTYGTG